MGAEGRRPRLFAVAKPAATLSLLLVVGLHPGGLAGGLVLGGIVLSAAGDAALLANKDHGAFAVGLALFLVAQLAYTAAFLAGGAVGATWTPLVGLAIFGTASLWVNRRVIAAAPLAMRSALAGYAAGITVMASVALASLAGPWPAAASVAAAAGAVSFYLSDVNLAWRLFRGPYPCSQMVTLALYWAGQLGIALAIRWANV